MSTQRCACGADCAGAYLCRRCAMGLYEALGGVDEVVAQLEIVRTRQHNYVGQQGGARTSTTVLPFHAGASEALWVLANTLASWAGYPAPCGIGYLTAGSVARMAARALRLRRLETAMPEAGACLDEIEAAVRQAEPVLVPRLPGLYVGPCPDCRADLVVHGTSLTAHEPVVCAECGATHDAAACQDRLRQRAEMHLVPGSVALSWVRLLTGRGIPRGTWDSWVARKRVLARAVDPDTGHPLYRFGEVHTLAVVYLSRPRQTRKSAAR